MLSRSAAIQRARDGDMSARQVVEREFADLLDLPRPAARPVAHVLDDQQRGEVALEIDRFLELAGEADAAVRGHSDLLAKLAQTPLLRHLRRLRGRRREAPAGRIAKLDEDQLALRRQRDRVRAERARAAHEPAGLHQLVRRGDARRSEAVGDSSSRFTSGCAGVVPIARAPCHNVRFSRGR